MWYHKLWELQQWIGNKSERCFGNLLIQQYPKSAAWSSFHRFWLFLHQIRPQLWCRVSLWIYLAWIARSSSIYLHPRKMIWNITIIHYDHREKWKSLSFFDFLYNLTLILLYLQWQYTSANTNKTFQQLQHPQIRILLLLLLRIIVIEFYFYSKVLV